MSLTARLLVHKGLWQWMLWNNEEVLYVGTIVIVLMVVHLVDAHAGSNDAHECTVKYAMTYLHASCVRFLRFLVVCLSVRLSVFV